MRMVWVVRQRVLVYLHAVQRLRGLISGHDFGSERRTYPDIYRSHVLHRIEELPDGWHDAGEDVHKADCEYPEKQVSWLTFCQRNAENLEMQKLSGW